MVMSIVLALAFTVSTPLARAGDAKEELKELVTKIQAKIKDKVKLLQDKKWEVIFLGANFDVTHYTAGSGIGFDKMRNVNFNDKWATASMTADLSSNTIGYARMGTAMNMADVFTTPLSTTTVKVTTSL